MARRDDMRRITDHEFHRRSPMPGTITVGQARIPQSPLNRRGRLGGTLSERMVRPSAVGVLLALLCGCGVPSGGGSGIAPRSPMGSAAMAQSAGKGDLGMLDPNSGQPTASSRFGPQYAKPAHCGGLTTADAPNFFIISGIRVALPVNNALARDSTIVQPGNAPIERYGIGLDDGTGTCAVFMPAPPVPVGGHLTVVVQAVKATGGGVWLGWVNVPTPA